MINIFVTKKDSKNFCPNVSTWKLKRQGELLLFGSFQVVGSRGNLIKAECTASFQAFGQRFEL